MDFALFLPFPEQNNGILKGFGSLFKGKYQISKEKSRISQGSQDTKNSWIFLMAKLSLEISGFPLEI